MAKVEVEIPERDDEIEAPKGLPKGTDDLVISAPRINLCIGEVIVDRWYLPDGAELDFEPSETREIIWAVHDQEIKSGYKDITGALGWNYPYSTGKHGKGANRYSQYGEFIANIEMAFPERDNYDNLDESSWTSDGDARGEFHVLGNVDIIRPRRDGTIPEAGDTDFESAMVKSGVRVVVANPEDMSALSECGLDEEQIDAMKTTWSDIKEEQELRIKSKSKKKSGRR